MFKIAKEEHDFNSRPSARGDRRRAADNRSASPISIHAPPRGATAWRADATPAHYFNSRPSARGDCIRRVTMDISIHAPPRGATPTSILISRQSEFQFTPLREGRRRDAAEIRRKLYISIHAPPRGATKRKGRRRKQSPISIHAPPRGATSKYQFFSGDCPHFNSRPSARGDTCPWASTARRTYFNSRPSARGDNTCTYIHLVVPKFQFTPLREGRHLKRAISERIKLFQFTPLREGRRSR